MRHYECQYLSNTLAYFLHSDSTDLMKFELLELCVIEEKGLGLEDLAMNKDPFITLIYAKMIGKAPRYPDQMFQNQMILSILRSVQNKRFTDQRKSLIITNEILIELCKD